MKSDIILAGVGGQGILSIAAVIGQAALIENLHIKQSEVHGMSQRGGAVMSHLRISSEPVHSDLIPLGKADVILSVEIMESLRYLPYLSSQGWVITNSKPFENIPNYPVLNDLIAELNKLPNKLYIDADEIAQNAGSIKASNMVILGSALSVINIQTESIIKSIEIIFKSKGQAIIDLNINALKLGMEASKKNNFK